MNKMDRIEKMVRKSLNLPLDGEPIPDVLFDSFVKNSDYAGIWIPKNPMTNDGEVFFWPPNIPSIYFTPSPWSSYARSLMGIPDEEKKPCKPDSEEFEVNMVEALVGWRQWKVHPVRKCLMSQYEHMGPKKLILWKPDEALEAECPKEQHNVPAEFCTCGIYAKDNMDDLDYVGVYGEVYGWGRYVRGEAGWRCQYAYPKSFYLTAEYAKSVAPETIDLLKSYHVPIVMEQPVLFYSPEEDGYEHRKDEANWNIRTRPQSPADEDADPDYDD